MHFCEKHKNRIQSKNFLIDADVTRIQSTTLIIKLMNLIIEHIILFKLEVDYVLSLNSAKSTRKTPRKSQKGLTPSFKK